MSISISYSASFASFTVADHLKDWSAYFGDFSQHPSHVGDGINVGSVSPGTFDGTQYALLSDVTDAALLFEGGLHHSAYTLWGSVSTITLGAVVGGAPASGYSIEYQEVSFSNLGLGSSLSEGHGGLVHQIVYGLMNGDTYALESTIDALIKAVDPSLSINNTYDQLAAAGVAHLNAASATSNDVSLVGVQDAPHDLALAA